MKAEQAIDDLGTTNERARSMLGELLHEGFDNDTNELAVALGRPADEIIDLLNGEQIDEDLLMKIRTLAAQRDIEIG